MDLNIIYESLDDKTRRRIDAKLAERRNEYSIQCKENHEEAKIVGYECMRIGTMIMIVSLSIAIGAILFGSTEIVIVFEILAFIGLFLLVLGFFAWGNIKF